MFVKSDVTSQPTKGKPFHLFVYMEFHKFLNHLKYGILPKIWCSEIMELDISHIAIKLTKAFTGPFHVVCLHFLSFAKTEAAQNTRDTLCYRSVCQFCLYWNDFLHDVHLYAVAVASTCQMCPDCKLSIFFFCLCDRVFKWGPIHEHHLSNLDDFQLARSMQV